jgi:hypothetical protein
LLSLKEASQLPVLVELQKQANGSVLDYHKAIDTWFDGVMERVNGAYKRKTQVFNFFIGLVIASVFNIDTLKIYSYLAENPQRTAILANSVAQSIGGERPKSDASALQSETQKKFLELALQAGVPIGWERKSCPEKQESNENMVGGWQAIQRCGFPLSSFPGWLLTALATLLGASFWFDTLKRFVSLRGSGSPPDPKP